MPIREHIFKAKRKYNGEWVNGYLSENTIIIAYDTFLAPVILKKPECVYDGIWCEIDPETVCEYTGLTDKNGKRIFEGDIVKRWWNGTLYIYKVVFDEELAAFICITVNENRFTTFQGDADFFEVIGNIYDNPELLEVGNNE